MKRSFESFLKQAKFFRLSSSQSVVHVHVSVCTCGLIDYSYFRLTSIACARLNSLESLQTIREGKSSNIRHTWDRLDLSHRGLHVFAKHRAAESRDGPTAQSVLQFFIILNDTLETVVYCDCGRDSADSSAKIKETPKSGYHVGTTSSCLRKVVR